MKKLSLLAWIAFAGCQAAQGPQIFQIAPSSAVRVASGSQLQVPASCPIYAPGDHDVDTPEQPWPDHVTIICAIDDQGNTYGTSTGDSPGGTLAVLPGNRELGYYIGFDASAGFTPDKAVLDGAAPSVAVFSAPTNVGSFTDCCAEGHPDARLTPQTVAVGEGGWLISFGPFDANPTQVAIDLDTAQLLPPGPTNTGSWFDRFYVNGAP